MTNTVDAQEKGDFPLLRMLVVSMATVASTISCGFNPRPESGTVVCKSEGGACCPAGFLCIGRGLSTAGGPSAGVCFAQAELPPDAVAGAHDYTPAIAYDRPCLVTDWVPPELVGVGTTPDAAPVDTRIPTAPSPDTGGAIPITPSHPAAGARIMPGSGRTFLVRQNGAVWAWGNNTEGRLGDGTTTSTSEPVPLPTLQSGVSALSTFWQHTCAVVSGALYCWGKNDHGQLGDGTKTNSGLPVPVVGLAAGVTDVAVSNEHTCAVVNGGAQCWGASYAGVRLLGDDSTVDRTVPRPVPTLSSGVTAIAAGYYYACAVVNGAVYCWGRNSEGELGDTTTTDRPTPVAVVGLEASVTAIAAGYRHTCAIVEGGALRCWGSNTTALGSGTRPSTPVLVQVKGLPGPVVDVSCGSGITCAIADPGRLFCWGGNSHYQIGDPLESNVGGHSTPFEITALKFDVRDIGVGAAHSCVVLTQGVKCWGENSDGAIGVEGGWGSKTPVEVVFKP